MSDFNDNFANDPNHAGKRLLTHTEVEALLTSYTAGEMQAAERAAVAQHLALCETCQQALTDIQHIRRLLRSMQLAPSSAQLSTNTAPSIADAVLAELAVTEQKQRRESPVKSTILTSPRKRKIQRRMSMVAAVFFLTMLVGSMIVVLNIARSNKGHTAHPTNALVPFPTLHTAFISDFYAILGHSLTALDARTGNVLWSQALDKRPELHAISSVGKPVVANGIVYITATNGFGIVSPVVSYVFAFHASDGSFLWGTQIYSDAEIQEFKGIAYGDLGFTADPTVANGMLYILSRTGKVYTFDAVDGTRKWEYDTHLTAFVDGGIWDSSSVIVHNGVVYGTMQNQVYAIDATSGKGLWSVSVNSSQIITDQLAISNGMVYGTSFALPNGGLNYGYAYAFNARTGMRIWTSHRTLVDSFTSPVVANGIVYLGVLGEMGKSGGSVYALRASDGSQLWYKSLDSGKMKMPQGGVYDPLIVVDGVLFLENTVSDYGAKLKVGQTVPGVGIIFALNASNGSVYWQRAFNNPYPTLAFIINGEIFAAADNDTIYRYSLSDGHEIWHHQYRDLRWIVP
ncbi:MAG TPA: PQQ-binding-like beta-propeller repeat protein [Ktedonobacteraceae bacterium]